MLHIFPKKIVDEVNKRRRRPENESAGKEGGGEGGGRNCNSSPLPFLQLAYAHFTTRQWRHPLYSLFRLFSIYLIRYFIFSVGFYLKIGISFESPPLILLSELATMGRGVDLD